MKSTSKNNPKLFAISILFFLSLLICGHQSFGQSLKEGEFVKAKIAPVLDGILDPVWKSAKTYPIKSLVDPLNGDFPAKKDSKAWFKGMWDEQYLYLFISVTDDIKRIYDKSQTEQPYQFDQGELYFDFHYTRPPKLLTPATTAFEFFRGPLKLIDTHLHSKGNEDGEQDSKRGWTQEFRIPLANLKNAPGKAGIVFGFDIHVNDGDTAVKRENALAWSDPDNTAWNNPQVWGKITLIEK